ncbi:hypothetical protein POJ06DRAFT_246518 [Lipomyces tetrasporus]|uniref:TauD/TfdA-like domain-containing protein n=1 Tax=Lipomyces tetrasporus TaxID=54092 RepID=A0AAD7VVJ8_9ASCO|nr:uncharacterized protein POJ06DRAFT_246518 [Lipomyces tetrasporus]KAJ8103076.1 hypothetical protein POJ06DRAFT_246518 [Lipomyces tetrasporus]
MSNSFSTIQSIAASTFRQTRDNNTTVEKDESGRLVLAGDAFEEASYPKYLPTWDTNEHYEPLTSFDFVDPGSRADSAFPNLLRNDNESLKVKRLTPKFGTEVRGVQLSQLSDAGKDELALLVAQRGVVVFRDQDFADLPIEDALKFSSHFGRNHIHPTSGAPKGFPQVHLVYRSKNDSVYDSFFQEHVSSIAWHSDVTYERQPPGTTFLAMLDGPETGGDTIFADTVEAYNRLSSKFREMLSGLEVLHSGVAQAQSSRAQGGVVRRDPIETFHPLIRQHPVTKQKALYVNPQFSRYIKGLKREESDAILNFIYDFISKSADIQVRASWEPKSVVVWDNRRTVHSALLDWASGERRHAFRLTPQAERPTEDWDKAEEQSREGSN